MSPAGVSVSLSQSAKLLRTTCVAAGLGPGCGGGGAVWLSGRQKIENGKFLCEVQSMLIRCELRSKDGSGEGRVGCGQLLQPCHSLPGAPARTQAGEGDLKEWTNKTQKCLAFF